jgi:hypothetical protein
MFFGIGEFVGGCGTLEDKSWGTLEDKTTPTVVDPPTATAVVSVEFVNPVDTVGVSCKSLKRPFFFFTKRKGGA